MQYTVLLINKLPFQLIYDYKDRGASFGLISLHPEKLPESEKETFRKIGIKIPSMA